jgi:hypothetical protein
MLSTLDLWEGRGRRHDVFSIETIPRHRKIFIIVNNFHFGPNFFLMWGLSLSDRGKQPWSHAS